MPRLVKSALGDAEAYTGDIRSHLWAIDPLATAQFTEDGSEAISQLGARLRLQVVSPAGGTASVETDEELKDEALGYHARP